MTDQIKIIKLKRSGSRVTITLSTQPQPLVVSDETVYRHRLVEGIVITTSQFQQLRREAGLYECTEVTNRTLAQREHSVGELRLKLQRREFEPEVIEEIINRYRRKGLLDDAQYAYHLSEHLVQQRPCGRSYLTAYLQRRHIDRTLAEQTADMVLGGQDETERAVQALQKRWRLFSQFELELARNKSYNYLSRRGFGYEASRRAFEHWHNQKTEETED